jgi:hypothetical protein
MTLQKYTKGAAVKLTDPRLNDDFKLKYNTFDPDWKRFWDEYRDRTLYVKDAIDHADDWDGDLHIYLQGLPDYVDHEVPFYSDEIEGIVDVLPDELFTI